MFVASYIVMFVASVTGSSLPGLVYYLMYITNVANFFVYLAVDAKFRNAIKKFF